MTNTDALAEKLAAAQELDEVTQGHDTHPRHEEYQEALDDLQNAIGWGEYRPLGWDDLSAAAETIINGGTAQVPEGAVKR